jgi:hypothetical protein
MKRIHGWALAGVGLLAVAGGTASYIIDRKSGPIRAAIPGGLVSQGSFVNDWFGCRVDTQESDSRGTFLGATHVTIHTHSAQIIHQQPGQPSDVVDVDIDKETIMENGHYLTEGNRQMGVLLLLMGAKQFCRAKEVTPPQPKSPTVRELWEGTTARLG